MKENHNKFHKKNLSFSGFPPFSPTSTNSSSSFIRVSFSPIKHNFISYNLKSNKFNKEHKMALIFYLYHPHGSTHKFAPTTSSNVYHHQEHFKDSSLDWWSLSLLSSRKPSQCLPFVHCFIIFRKFKSKLLNFKKINQLPKL